MKMLSPVAKALLLTSALALTSTVANAAEAGPKPSADTAIKASTQLPSEVPQKVAKAVQNAAAYFDLETYEVLHAKRSNGDGYFWEITLRSVEDDPKTSKADQVVLSMHVSEADGKLVYLTISGHRTSSNRAPSETTALHAADDFVDQVVSGSYTRADELVQIRTTDVIVPFYPIINHIPVKLPAFYIYLDSNGKILKMETNREKVSKSDLPDPNKILTAEKIKPFVEKELEVELVYDAKLKQFVYVPSPLGYFDAYKGDPVKWPYLTNNEKLVHAGSDKSSVTSTPDHFKQMGIEYFGLNPKTAAARQHQEVHPGETPKTVYTLTDDADGEIEITTDKETGSILKLKSDKVTNHLKITSDKGKELGLQFIQNELGLPSGEYLVKIRTILGDLPAWMEKVDRAAYEQLSIHPLQDQVPFKDPVMRVWIDLSQGTIAEMEAIALKREETTVGKIITQEDAKKSLLESLQVDLYYVYVPESGRLSLVPKLMYEPSYFTDGWYVDAVTGKVGKK
ncbi:hypothetical protein NDK47_17455 [Brevibacillus ruminantium]|uniref:PepSY domain-containing protein n=1 Tax=Brevibacillus ruminantium TaxID=2950604 RepID=A0ABY4WA76_9BACL|nr:hypothetical protein [Brevibacillus ruminantium]USG63937.1 hypothetical protein NDK47_17455 [Brevibacillus ruminantium]